MRYYSLIIILLVSMAQVNGQEIIYKTDGTIVAVKILEVTPTLVKYTSVSDTNGLRFVISKDYIAKIVYPNGETIAYKVDSADTLRKRMLMDIYHTDINGRFLSLNLFDILSGIITLNYEYKLRSGDFSLRVPLSMGNNALKGKDPSSVLSRFHSRNKIFGTGIGINYYPGPNQKVAPYSGVLAELTMSSYWPYYRDPNASSSMLEENGIQFGISFHGGLLLELSPRMNLGMSLGLGLAYSHYINGWYTNPIARCGFNIGYKF